MVVDTDVVAIEQPRQVVTGEGMVIDRDGRIVGTVNGAKYQFELRIAVDEQGLHGPKGSLCYLFTL